MTWMSIAEASALLGLDEDVVQQAGEHGILSTCHVDLHDITPPTPELCVFIDIELGPEQLLQRLVRGFARRAAQGLSDEAVTRFLHKRLLESTQEVLAWSERAGRGSRPAISELKRLVSRVEGFFKALQALERSCPQEEF